jgi:DNA-directed RNA polymerase subunit RPC12/RpoP
VVVTKLICPKCNSREVYPSNLKHAYESLLAALHVYSYRCHSCSKRFRLYTSPSDQRVIRDQILIRIGTREFAARATM